MVMKRYSTFLKAPKIESWPIDEALTDLFDQLMESLADLFDQLMKSLQIYMTNR